MIADKQIILVDDIYTKGVYTIGLYTNTNVNLSCNISLKKIEKYKNLLDNEIVKC